MHGTLGPNARTCRESRGYSRTNCRLAMQDLASLLRYALITVSSVGEGSADGRRATGRTTPPPVLSRSFTTATKVSSTLHYRQPVIARSPNPTTFG